jgi:serine/threonine-protein kinase
VIEASAAPSKVCAACGGRYPGDALFCPTDGTPLQSQAAAERDGAPDSDPYLRQEISGHIEIRQVVGVGAMGRVYRAFQRGIDRDVAVKILHRELSANAQLVSRFTREAKVASRLQHPNVVQVLLTGQLPDRALYMVMEYLDGLSLQSALAAAGGSLALPRALHITLQLCEAVGEAHAQGIVHRDLKPENVMLVRRGADPDFVKVLDFGIARINWGEQSVATAAGLIFGTARYISPEGAQGNAVGPASDVYSISTLLFQMLSGRTPFDGEQAVGLLVQQIHDPAPDLRSIARAAYVPPSIAEVVMANLVKDPAKREPDARALGHAIFDAAKVAGLSPDEFSRPLRRPSSAIRMASAASTFTAAQQEATAKTNGKTAPSAATVKWEPPSEFQAKLADGMRRAAGSHPSYPDLTPSPSPSPSPMAASIYDGSRAPPSRARATPGLDSTLDDHSLDTPVGGQRTAASPAFPSVTPSSPVSVPRTMPGDPEGPVRTHYTPPTPEATGSAPALSSRAGSDANLARATMPSGDDLAAAARYPGSPGSRGARRSLGLIAVCFILGAAIAAGWAWRAGKIGPGADAAAEDRCVTRATAAMFQKHFGEPAPDNVKDITDDGLRRWPKSRRLVDIRVRAASEVTAEAIAQRSSGDLLEALRLAKLAQELDPDQSSARRLVEQYESELASFSPSAAPTLTPPPVMPSSSSPGQWSGSRLVQGPMPARVEYKALVDVSHASPRLGQAVDITARVAPGRGSFDQPGFTVVGPGVPGGVRVAASGVAPGVFKGSYAFEAPGKFEITFTTQVDGKPISAKRAVSATPPASPPTPAPAPPPPAPAPTPAPTASVKWM